MCNYGKMLIVLLVINQCLGNNYIILANDDGFLRQCDNADNLGNFNMANLMEFNVRNSYGDDMETLVTNGNVTFKVELPSNVSLGLHLEILEWRRGKWEYTLFSIRRDDLCSVLYDPTEIWYSLTSNIPEEDRVCPPQKGTTYHLNDMRNRIELQDVKGLNLEGQYKVIAHLTATEYATCVAATVDIWKN